MGAGRLFVPRRALHRAHAARHPAEAYGKGHPPIWVACGNPPTFAKAGALGIGAIAFNFEPIYNLRGRIEAYKEAIANSVAIVPERGASPDRLERKLFGMPGVASVQPIVGFTETIRNEIDRFLGILTVVEAAILLLALLIAFNSASISADERARDHATMFAFGLPMGTVVRMNVIESGLIGVLGTALGLGIGWLLLGWLVNSLIPETFPELGIEAALAWSTIATALGLGILAVASAPLLTVGRLRRMDVPSTLRVME